MSRTAEIDKQRRKAREDPELGFAGVALSAFSLGAILKAFDQWVGELNRSELRQAEAALHMNIHGMATAFVDLQNNLEQRLEDFENAINTQQRRGRVA